MWPKPWSGFRKEAWNMCAMKKQLCILFSTSYYTSYKVYISVIRMYYTVYIWIYLIWSRIIVKQHIYIYYSCFRYWYYQVWSHLPLSAHETTCFSNTKLKGPAPRTTAVQGTVGETACTTVLRPQAAFVSPWSSLTLVSSKFPSCPKHIYKPIVIYLTEIYRFESTAYIFIYILHIQIPYINAPVCIQMHLLL